MDKPLIIVTLILLIPNSRASAQTSVLLPVKHGLDLIYRNNVSKEEIIDDIRFGTGKDDEVDILRFDNVGKSIGGDGPLIISSEEPIQVDSLGLTPHKLSKDSLKRLLSLIKSLDTRIYKRVHSECLFRITYRLNGTCYQYYISNPKNSTAFFKKIESVFKNDKEALRKLFYFLGPSGLREPSLNGPKWVY